MIYQVSCRYGRPAEKNHEHDGSATLLTSVIHPVAEPEPRAGLPRDSRVLYWPNENTYGADCEQIA